MIIESKMTWVEFKQKVINVHMQDVRALCMILFMLILSASQIKAQSVVLDDMGSKAGWSFIQSDGVDMKLSVGEGIEGNALKFEYDFEKGTGYGGIQKFFPIDIPENFELTFYLKAESPANNFEIKFIDSTGNNVWWVNKRNFTFPEDWKKIRIRKRHISFAWGPADDHSLKRIDRIEFTVASFVGGKGAIWIDDVRFQALPPETGIYPIPVLKASSSARKNEVKNILDGSSATFWESKRSRKHEIMIDFQSLREYGGMDIKWSDGQTAGDFDISISDDKINWENVYQVRKNKSTRSFIYLPESQSAYMKIVFLPGEKPYSVGISELRFIDIKNSMTKNDFLIYCAKNSKEGYFPPFFQEQAIYWTISGVNNDVKEALLSEHGMVEVEKSRFSLEPMIKIDGLLYNWSNVTTSHSIGQNNNPANFKFIPTMNWDFEGIRFRTEIASGGEANVNSQLYLRYTFTNHNSVSKNLKFYLLVRPFQVNPYYQFLNMAGGSGKIYNIHKNNDYEVGVDNKVIISQIPFNDFGASSWDEGNIVEMIELNDLPENVSVYEGEGNANSFIKYLVKLNAGEVKSFIIKIPYHDEINYTENSEFNSEFNEAIDFWNDKVNHIRFNLPESGNRIINTLKSNLVYILINRDLAGIQPGSRSYERSWIRDGSLTSSALLKNGIVKEVRDFIAWYAKHLYENGKVPCVVDTRGPDPVPEHDSHGQFIYLIREYFNFTRDTAFLQTYNNDILNVVNYIKSLISERLKDEYLTGSDSLRAFYGLVPESISHEGYSAKPMHSYWDDFFVLKGLKDVMDIQLVLGEKENYEFVKTIKDEFQTNLYNSLRRTMKYKNIDYIPGCVELGDFDPTSTTILLTPCNEYENLPKPEIYNTFNKYYDYFVNRRSGKIEWINYTPYENRIIGSFIILNQIEKAHELIDFFLQDQRPQGWGHWAEVVWKDYRIPRFIGDMPHTWCGSDFINSIRSMFVYEDELDRSLVVAAALYQDWIDNIEGISIENLPTYYGEVSYSIKKYDNRYDFNIWGNVTLPPNGVKIRNFNGSKKPQKVIANGEEIKSFTDSFIHFHEYPCKLEIYY